MSDGTVGAADEDDQHAGAGEPVESGEPGQAGDLGPVDEHPINRRTMAYLLAAVLAVAIVVIAAVILVRGGEAAPTGTGGQDATDGTGSADGGGRPATGSGSTIAPGGTGASAESVPALRDAIQGTTFEVAEATGSGDIPVYGSAAAGAPIRTLPAAIPVGVEKRVTIPLVMLVRSHPADGWLEVFLPVRPNGSTGFVRTDAFKVLTHHYHLEVALSAFRLKAFDGDTMILDAPIAQGSGANPTPGGLYYTTMLLKPPDPSGPYGTYAYGLSGYSDTLTTFSGGDGQLGIHGTNQPELMGQTVSHGCIRLRNEDIERLAKVLPLGVPVFVQP